MEGTGADTDTRNVSTADQTTSPNINCTNSPRSSNSGSGDSDESDKKDDSSSSENSADNRVELLLPPLPGHLTPGKSDTLFSNLLKKNLESG